MSTEPLQSPVQWSMSISAAVSWKHSCGILLCIFPNQRMGHITCNTASFDNMLKSKNEEDVYHILAFYLKEDFWSVLLNFSEGICSNCGYSKGQTYILESLWSQKSLSYCALDFGDYVLPVAQEPWFHLIVFMVLPIFLIFWET